MKKPVISKLFLYKYRFIIGYTILGLAFIFLLFSLPLFAQKGLSSAEMESATNSYNTHFNSIVTGDLVNLPYRTLQKIAITTFGFNAYAIKLPSILFGLLLGLLLILLLNRWFKSNVSLLASCLIILSTPFLFLAGSGTPLIMIVFWPTLLLWLGSKIQGEKRPKPIYCLVFAIALLLAIFTPYMIYFALFCIIFVFFQPHLRFVVKNLPKIPLIITCLIVIVGIAALGINIINHPKNILELLFSSNFTISNFAKNINYGLAILFSWKTNLEGVFLSPLIGLPVFALALIGLFSTTKGFFASRNSIASLLLVFAIIITGFNSDAAIFTILPLSILIAHGLKYLLEKWYGLFPENPYARIFAIFPLSILFGFIIIPSLIQYIYGYHYAPSVTNEFSSNLEIINNNLTNETLVVSENIDFYRILEDFTDIKIISNINNIESNITTIATLGKVEQIPASFSLSRIITSEKSDNSDIIYLYSEQEEKGE